MALRRDSVVCWKEASWQVQQFRLLGPEMLSVRSLAPGDHCWAHQCLGEEKNNDVRRMIDCQCETGSEKPRGPLTSKCDFDLLNV